MSLQCPQLWILISLNEPVPANFTTVVMLITFFSDLLLLPFLAGVVVLLITCTESWSATSRLLLPLSARWFFDRGCWFEAEEPPLFRGWLFTVLSRLFCICSISKAALLSTLCFSEYLIFVCLSKKTRLGKNQHMYFKKTNVCTLWIQQVAVCWLLGMLQKLKLSTNIFTTKYAPRSLIEKNIRRIQNSEFTLKIRFWYFLTTCHQLKPQSTVVSFKCVKSCPKIQLFKRIQTAF